jgi:DNA-binding response OmpR family regulator
MAVKKKILIIDEDKFITRLYVSGLDEAGYDIEVASSGEAGLTEVKEFQPDLVLLDIILPEMNGIEVLKELKKDTETAHIPVAMLTNIQTQETATKASEAGSSEYLVKVQYTIEELVKKVGDILA